MTVKATVVRFCLVWFYNFDWCVWFFMFCWPCIPV